MELFQDTTVLQFLPKITKMSENRHGPIAFSQQANPQALKLLKLMPNQSVKDFKSHSP